MLAEHLEFKGSQQLNVDVKKRLHGAVHKEMGRGLLIDTGDTTDKILEAFDFSLFVCG